MRQESTPILAILTFALSFSILQAGPLDWKQLTKQVEKEVKLVKEME